MHVCGGQGWGAVLARCQAGAPPWGLAGARGARPRWTACGRGRHAFATNRLARAGQEGFAAWLGMASSPASALAPSGETCAVPVWYPLAPTTTTTRVGLCMRAPNPSKVLSLLSGVARAATGLAQVTAKFRNISFCAACPPFKSSRDAPRRAAWRDTPCCTHTGLSPPRQHVAESWQVGPRDEGLCCCAGWLAGLRLLWPA